MADIEEGGPGEKEANKPDSPKPDQEVAPPLVSSKGETACAISFVFGVMVRSAVLHSSERCVY